MSATDTPRRSRKAVTAAAQQRYGARVRAVYKLALEYVAESEAMLAVVGAAGRCRCGKCWACRFRAHLDPEAVRRRVEQLAAEDGGAK